MNKQPHNPGNTRAGFTLLEVLLAVAILGIVITAVYSTWSAALNGWRRGSDVSEVFQRQRIVMDALKELTQSAVFFSASPELYTILGTKNPGLGASVTFVTASEAFLPPSEAMDAGMRRVTISLEQDQYRRTYLAIVNQPALSPEDQSSEPPPQAHVISMDVSGFYIRYRDPRSGDWDETWEETAVPPSAIEFTVVFGQQGDRLPPVVVTRAVGIPVAAFISQGNGGLPSGFPGTAAETTNQVQRRNVGMSGLQGNTGGQRRTR
jgi:prepilin-type N-terminal cleavage/methylation domain-containing protein